MTCVVEPRWGWRRDNAVAEALVIVAAGGGWLRSGVFRSWWEQELLVDHEADFWRESKEWR